MTQARKLGKGNKNNKLDAEYGNNDNDYNANNNDEEKTQGGSEYHTADGNTMFPASSVQAKLNADNNRYKDEYLCERCYKEKKDIQTQLRNLDEEEVKRNR